MIKAKKNNSKILSYIQSGFGIDTHPWLDPNNPKCKADNYFKEISYFVKLSGKH